MVCLQCFLHPTKSCNTSCSLTPFDLPPQESRKSTSPSLSSPPRGNQCRLDKSMKIKPQGKPKYASKLWELSIGVWPPQNRKSEGCRANPVHNHPLIRSWNPNKCSNCKWGSACRAHQLTTEPKPNRYVVESYRMKSTAVLKQYNTDVQQWETRLPQSASQRRWGVKKTNCRHQVRLCSSFPVSCWCLFPLISLQFNSTIENPAWCNPRWGMYHEEGR